MSNKNRKRGRATVASEKPHIEDINISTFSPEEACKLSTRDKAVVNRSNLSKICQK